MAAARRGIARTTLELRAHIEVGNRADGIADEESLAGLYPRRAIAAVAALSPHATASERPNASVINRRIVRV